VRAESGLVGYRIHRPFWCAFIGGERVPVINVESAVSCDR
jgi:hypothetical protein